MVKEEPQTPAQRIQGMLKAWVKDFSKTPYVYPVSLGIAAVVYYLSLVYASSICLINLLTPLVLLGALWMFNVRTAKKLAIVGLVAVVVLSGIWIVVLTQLYTTAEPTIASSEDGTTLTNGIVTPFKGNSSQVYNFTLTVHLKNSTSGPIFFKYVNVVIRSAEFPSEGFQNVTMYLQENDTATLTQRYYYATELPPINAYVFLAEYPNGTQEIGGQWSGGLVGYDLGPYSSDSGGLAIVLLPFSFYQNLVQMYLPYILIVGMIWWTRRAKRMREKQIEKWKLEEAEKEAAQPKSSQLKVPSLAKAMGTDKGTGDTFVCSECGADVPADATVCPKCGEKFD